MKLYFGLLGTLCGFTVFFLCLTHLVNNTAEWWHHLLIYVMLFGIPGNVYKVIGCIKQQKSQYSEIK